MWMRQPAAPLDFMAFKSINSSIVAGSYAMGSGFQLSVFDGESQSINRINERLIPSYLYRMGIFIT